MENKQVKYGAVLSYILILINTFYGLFVNPYILRIVGMADFGVYKTMSSFTAAFMVLDLGLGGTTMRYIARFRADKQEDKISNYCAMSLMQAGVIVCVVAMCMICAYFSLDSLYGSSLTADELVKGKVIYIVLVINMCIHIIENVFSGIITGYNRFLFSNGTKMIRLIVRILCNIILIAITKNIIVIVLADLVLTMLLIFVDYIYIRKKIGLHIKYTSWDKKIFAESFRYTILMFLTMVVNQINGNLDNVAIGATLGAESVAIYSYGLLIFGMFQQISCSISGVMLPTVTNILVNDDNDYTKTKDTIVNVGRIQFLLLGAAMCGFFVVGKDFIKVWLGNGFEDVYYIVLILIVPAMLELCVNTCLAVLRAKNMIGFKTVAEVGMAVINLVITIGGLILFKNYYAAATGTAISIFIGSVVAMGIYYYKMLRFNMLGIYTRIFKKIWLCIIISGAGAYVVTLFVSNAVLRLFGAITVFIIIYAVTLMMFGLNNNEKNEILKVLKK